MRESTTHDPTSSDQPAVVARGLTKRYRGSTVALDGVDLELAAGEVVGILGPNGAGKSTLMKLVCGLVHPTSGELRVFGAPAGSRQACADLGYLAELFRFPSWLTATETLRFHQRLAGSPGGAAERARLLEQVGLAAPALHDRRSGTFSKGMQQRLGIAQALVGSPRLVLLDEPTSALDPVGRHMVRDVIAELRAAGVTVLLNSHLLGEVERSCDRVIVMRGGRVERIGSPAEFAEERGVEVDLASGTREFADVDRAGVPELVRRLVAEGEQVFGVRVRTSSLEDAYLAAFDHDNDGAA